MKRVLLDQILSLGLSVNPRKQYRRSIENCQSGRMNRQNDIETIDWEVFESTSSSNLRLRNLGLYRNSADVFLIIELHSFPSPHLRYAKQIGRWHVVTNWENGCALFALLLEYKDKSSSTPSY